MKNKKVFAAVAGAFFIAVFFTMFRGAGAGRILFGHDTLNIYHAFRVFAKSVFDNYGAMPVWMPHIFMGVPLIASSSLLYFYPTDLAFLVFHIQPESTYTADIIIHMLAAAGGTFLFMRKNSAGREAAFFGAAAIMISGYIISYIYPGHWNNIKAGALIPFVFYFVGMALENKKIFYSAAAGMIMALQVLATGMQIMAYTYIGVLLYGVYYMIFEEKEKGARLKITAALLVSAVFAAVFSAAQFIPSLQYKDYSWRGDFSYENFISWSMPPAEIISFIFPQFFGLFGKAYWGQMPFNLTTYYMGIIPFLLVPFAFISRRNRKFSFFAASAAVIFLVFSFGGYTPVYRLFYYLPVLNQFRVPSRFLYVFTFFVIVLAATGLNNILTMPKRDDYRLSAAYKTWKVEFFSLAVLYIIFLFITVTGEAGNLASSLYKGWKSSAMESSHISLIGRLAGRDISYFILTSLGFLIIVYLVVSKRLKNALIAALILASLNFVDVYRIDRQFINYEDYRNYINPNNAVTAFFNTQKGIYRAAGTENVLGPNRGIYYGIESIDGVHGLVPSKHMKLKNNGLFGRIDINRIFNVKYYVSAGEINAPGLEKEYSLGTNIYRDTKARERVFFADRVIKFKNDSDVLDYMKSNLIDGESVLMTEDPGITASAAEKKVFIDIYDYTPGRVRISCRVNKDGILILSNLYYKKWKAKVDGKPEKIYNVNYASMGIKLREGVHDIDFYYGRSGIYTGIFFMFMGLLALIALYFAEVKGMFKKGEKIEDPDRNTDV